MRVKYYTIDKHFKGKYRPHFVAAKCAQTAKELLGMGVREADTAEDIRTAVRDINVIFYMDDSGEYRRRF